MTKVEICENKKHTTPFKYLCRGDFFWLDDTLFMKIHYGEEAYNSVVLETGFSYMISDDIETIPINNISICVKD